jgi:uncharacterized protein (TIGR02145 family)
LNAGPGRTWYLWSTGATTQSIWVKYQDSYRVKAQDVHCIVYDTVMVTTVAPPYITNNPLSKTICTGESTNIPVTANLAGVMFHWTATLTSGNLSGFSADSGLVINQTLVNNGSTAGVVTYHVTPKMGDCAGTPVDYVVTVNVGDRVDVTVAVSGNTVCAGTLVTFTATAIYGGSTPVFQWQVNGVNVGTNSPTYAYVPTNGDIVKCILISSNTVCTSNNPATSTTITMVVNPLQPVSVSVSPSANPVCAGTLVNFTAVPVNGGTTPHFQWEVNGLIAGTNSPVYSYVPANGDAITCTLTSNESCPSGNPALSNIVIMSVSPLLTTGVAIAVSSNPFCAGSSVTFTATPANGGVAPIFQWKVNGVNSGTNSPVFDYIPVNGDIVTCSMVSSDACSTGNPAQSNPITMVVNANLPAGITIAATANPFCPGSAVTYTATPVNGGSAPAYQWRVNAVNAINATNAVFSFSPLPGDEVSCVVTSNLNCVTANPATSNIITMVAAIKPSVTFTPCNDLITTVNAKPFQLKGGTPIGGVYSGPGVTSATGMFDPASAGTGIRTIQYSYTNVATCSDFKTITITVQPAPAFNCGNTLTDIRDGRQYTTFSLPNGKCWTSANLDFGFRISELVPQTDNCIAERYFRPTSHVPRPSFYQWDELMAYQTAEASQGLCPPGWHVPTSAEWDELLSFYIGPGQAAGPMKDTLLFNGFQSYQQGFLYLNHTWAFATGLYAGSMYWSSTLSGSSTPSGSRAIARGLNEYNPSVSKYEALRGNGFGVRCVKDM